MFIYFADLLLILFDKFINFSFSLAYLIIGSFQFLLASKRFTI